MSLMEFHKHERRRGGRYLAMAVFTLAVTAWVFCEGFAAAQDQETNQAIRQANSLSHAFRAASGKVLPTVVTIRTSIMEPEAELAAKLGVKPGEGVLVSEVFADSPAEAAGFKTGDLIVSFAGRPTTSSRGLQSIVERCPMGSTQEVRVLRDGKKMTLSMVAKPLPDDLGKIARKTGTREGKDQEEPASFDSEMLDAEIVDLTPQIAKHLGYEGTTGVVITRIDPAGMAAQAGLRPGTIILQVDGKPVKNVAQLQTALKNASLDDGVLLLVRMGRGQRYVVLKSP